MKSREVVCYSCNHQFRHNIIVDESYYVRSKDGNKIEVDGVAQCPSCNKLKYSWEVLQQGLFRMLLNDELSNDDYYVIADVFWLATEENIERKANGINKLMFNIGAIKKGTNIMRIAVTYENGNVFQHFGHTEQFKLYDVENGQIVCSQIVDTKGSGHGALAGFLKAAEVDALICGGIGMGAQMALAEAGIKLYGGVQGSADEAAKALAEDNLNYDPEARCDHHDHEEGHECGHGNHECGHGGCHN